ncbi:hypothetical protein [Arenimonas fontis]|uniref:Uncharacterized protein n=1 Tax=Arenimonas fontis TaxID=2608255 RepID=A0A5B2ZB55_9GAMM|nr:hypothetical protein [Arenimonas fontis]KAA2285346.1 hypothetical protein F0415_05360 [Arenimonas fontis]
MSFHHVIAKVGAEDELRALFTDLSADELKERFIRPYEMGRAFFSGNDLIFPANLRSVQIIRTDRPSKVERDEINRMDRESIDRLNDSRSGVYFISLGRGYEPQDIAEVGLDVTQDLIKGPPGFRAGKWEPSKKALAWIGGIVATIVATGVVKWLDLD